jgi:hypothetical protein
MCIRSFYLLLGTDDVCRKMGYELFKEIRFQCPEMSFLRHGHSFVAQEQNLPFGVCPFDHRSSHCITLAAYLRTISYSYLLYSPWPTSMSSQVPSFEASWELP